MNKFSSILASLLTGAIVISGCDVSESDVMPETPERIVLLNDYFSTTINTPVPLNILANDTITTAAEVTIQQPQNGVLIPEAATGTYLYKPQVSRNSEETISYTVCKDGDCKTASVVIKVMDIGQCIVEANADRVSTDYRNTLEIGNGFLLSNDRTCGRAKFSIPQNQTIIGGTVTVAQNGRSIRFTPTEPEIGTTSFYYLIEGSNGRDTARVAVTVIPPSAENTVDFGSDSN